MADTEKKVIDMEIDQDGVAKEKKSLIDRFKEHKAELITGAFCLAVGAAGTLILVKTRALCTMPATEVASTVANTIA